MAYNLAKIRQDVRDNLDDDEYDSSIIDQAVNDYQRELFENNDLRLAETVSSLTLTSATSATALPSDFRKAIALQNITVGYLRDLTDYELDADLFYRRYIDPNIVGGVPSYWTIYGTNIIVDRPASATFTLRLLYLKAAPTLVGDSDVPLVPETFEEMMKLGAYERILRREDEYSLSNAERTVLQGLENAFISRFGRGRTSAKPHIMRKR